MRVAKVRVYGDVMSLAGKTIEVGLGTFVWGWCGDAGEGLVVCCCYTTHAWRLDSGLIGKILESLAIEDCSDGQDGQKCLAYGQGSK